MRLSYSQWNTYAECPFKWKAKYQLGVKGRGPGPAAERGIAIHNMLEMFVRGKDTRLPWDTVGGVKGVPALGKDHPMHNIMVRLRDWPNGDKYCEKKFGFSIDWDPYPHDSDTTAFLAIIDAVASANGVAEVYEWKSGKPKSSYAEQRLLYALAAHRVFLPKKVIVTTHYVDMTSPPERIVVGEEAVVPLQNMWSRNRETIMNDKILAPKPSEGCRWCDARKSAGGPCPMPY